MKKIFFAIAAVLFAQYAFSQGIVFLKEASLQNALKKAAAEKKLLFIELYSDSCGACKDMDKTVFSQKEAGSRYNAFINIRLNTSAGEGAALLKKYDLNSGACVFINNRNELVYRFSIPVSLEQLLQHADRAAVESFSNRPIGESMIAYATKRTDRSFLRNYLTQLARLQMPASSEYDQYLSLLSPAERTADSTINLILLNRSPLDIHSVTFRLLWNRYAGLASNLQFKRKLDGTIAGSMRAGSEAVYRSGKKEELDLLL